MSTRCGIGFTDAAVRGADVLLLLRGMALAAALSVVQVQAAAVAVGGHAVAVGATPASFEVDQQGGATYRIPIAVAPGPGGFHPSPTLAYSSHTGNGPLGAGWTIEGLSAIHRCAAIAPLHGYRGRVDMGADDRLCIDGRFLVPVDDAATPLQGREFRTRVESFTRVTVNGGAAGAAAANGFTAWTKEGQTIVYGDSAAARIGRSGEVFSWLMSRVSDRAGNTMHIRYAVFGNERHVERIDYETGSVSFEYEARADASTAYLAGMAFPLTRRLVRVVAQTGDRLVREYRFGYEDSDGVRPARLESVTECAESGHCLRPTVFGWQPSPAFDLLRWGSITHPADRAGEHRRFQQGDFNGDGLTDIYQIHGSRGGAYDAIQVNLGDGLFESVQGPWTEVNKSDDLLNFHFADFDGDGLTDVYQFRYREAYDRLYLTRLSQGSLSFLEVAGIDSGARSSPAVARGCVHRDCLRFGDFNGDGRTDVYRIRHAGTAALTDEVHLSNGDGSYERADGIDSVADSNETRAATQVARISLGDFNGDGISDIYRIRDANVSGTGVADDIYLTLRPGEYRRVNGIETRFNSRTSNRAQLLRVKFGDFNGDGLTDVYYVTPGYRGTPDEVYLSHGDGRYTLVEAPGFPESSRSSGLQLSLSRIRLGDFNGDGLTDVYYMTAAGRDDIYFAATDGWRRHADIVVGPAGTSRRGVQDIERVHFGDFNGDGATDAYHIEDAYKGVGRIYTARRQINQVNLVRDGLGAGLRIVYASLVASPVHDLSMQTAPAAVRTPPPLRVVAAVERFDSSRTLYTEHHRYGGARSDPSGFGFLGFAWHEVRDQNKQLVTRTVYSQAFPYFGSMLEQTVALAEGTQLSVSHMEYAMLDLNGGKTVLPYPTGSRSQRYELDGAFVSAETVSFSDHDEYGNARTVETVTEDEDRRFGRIARHSYLNDSERWILGVRVSTELTYSDDIHTDVMWSSAAEYDPDTGFVLSQTSEPGAALAVTRRYQYDGFGNRVVERVEPALASARPATLRREYDEAGRFVVRAVNAEGHAVTHIYDARFGRATLTIDANGLVSSREYDDWGRLVGEVRPDGVQMSVVRTYELPEDAPLGSVYLTAERVVGRPARRTFHDASGQVLSVRTTGFDGRVLFEDREYDGYGRVLRISLPHRGDQPADWVERRYDRLDRLIEEDSPLVDRAITTRRFDYRGLVVEHLDELGHSKFVTRDALGRIVGVTEPMGAEMLFEYDPAGRMIKVTDAHGNQTSMEYDVFGNRTRVVHPDQGVQRFAYDPFGRTVNAADAAGSQRRMVYDRLGRLVERAGPEGVARWSYDTSENGVGRLSQESYNGYVRRFRYDGGGRLATVEDHRGYATVMTYNKGRLQKMHYPRGFVVERVYNEHGYLSAVRSPFFETGDFNSVPAFGEISREAFYRGKAAEYASRALFYRRWAAQLETADDSDFRVGLNQAADELERGGGRLRDETSGGAEVYCARAAAAKLVQAEGLLTDAAEAGVRLRLRAPGAAYIERQMYARMALSERMLDEVQECLPTADVRAQTADDYIYYWRALAQDTVGRVVSERTGDGWQTRYRYHTGNGYLQEITSDTGDRRGVRRLVYDYDEADNLLSRTDHAQRISEHFGYDALDRMTAAVVLSEDGHDDYNKINFYRYDPLGNLVFHSGVGAYAYGSGGEPPHAVVQVADDTYEYDVSGNLVRGPELAAEWFSFGKPASLDDTKGNRLEFDYDANGERILKRSSDGGITSYLGKFYQKTLRADGAVEHRYYIYVGERLVALRHDSESGGRVSRKLRYLHHDALGSVDTVSDDAGEIVERLSYTPFGERRESNWRASGAPVLPMLTDRGFTGHEHLDEVGLVHMNGRIYDPRIGRFLSPDPYVPSPLSTQSYNRYSYALNNPMKFTDPSGFFLKKVFKGIKRAVKKTVRFVRRNARIIAAVAAGYYAGVWASNAVVKSAVSKLVWSPGGMWSGTYISAYNGALASGAVVGGAVSGGVSSALAGGDLRSVLANTVSAGALGGLGVSTGGRWTAPRVLSSAAINGAAAAVAGGSFGNAALSSLKWGGLRYAAAAMRRAMVAQSLLNPANAGGLSTGFFGDNFKLGGGRYNAQGGGPSPLGGHQGGQGQLFGTAYEADSLWDRVVEAYAGPHDYLNSFYWYDRSGNIKNGLTSFQRSAGEVLNGANVFIATPFAAASLTPDHVHALPR